MSWTASDASLKALLEELAGSGSPVDLSVADTEVENEKVEIEQTGGIIESELFLLEDGRVACMAHIAVTNQTSRPIDLIDVRLPAPWDDSLFEWLMPGEVKFHTKKGLCSHLLYRFPGHGPEFEFREVINQPLLERRKLPGKSRLEGSLLGIGGLMPDELSHGQLVPMSLTITGSDHAEYSTTITFWTDQLLARAKTVRGTRTSIFAKPAEQGAMRPRDVPPTAPVRAGQPPASNRFKFGEARLRRRSAPRPIG